MLAQEQVHSICPWLTHSELIWVLQVWARSEQGFVLLLGFTWVLESLLFFLHQIANDWQESWKSERMLLYFPLFSSTFSEISACNILMLWHKFA